MKAKIFAYITLCTIMISVLANTYYIKRVVGDFAEEVKSLDIYSKDAINDAKKMQEDFMHLSLFISLTVSHDDLTNIENDLAELVGCLTVEDTNGATITKSRLLNSLEHLKRLSGINFDAII